jgi:hypothetical protein
MHTKVFLFIVQLFTVFTQLFMQSSGLNMQNVAQSQRTISFHTVDLLQIKKYTMCIKKV